MFDFWDDAKRVGDFSVSCDGTAVKCVNSVKYLGVILDSNLNGALHVAELIKKCSGRISFLIRNSSMLDPNCRKILCSALVQPYLDYCSSSWYNGITKSLKNKLDVLQRRMIRFINFYGPRHHVDEKDAKALSWLFVKIRVDFFKAVHVHKVVQKKAPSYICRRFVPVLNTHGHNTCGSNKNFFISKELSRSLSSFSYTAAVVWNKLPVELKEIESEKRFRQKVREFLMSTY